MKKFIPPNRPPSNKCAIAAVYGRRPSVIVQDESGSQIVVTPKMARTLADQLIEMASIAEGTSVPATPVGLIQLPPTYFH